MAASAPVDLYAAAVPDEARTLGGIKDDIAPEHPSVIGHMVRSLMPGQDLTSVTIPAFFLEPRSLLERMADTLMHPDLLLAAVACEDPVDRMKGMVKWFLSGFHYKTVGVKKPFNPIVGETFACVWEHDDGSRSEYFAEQVGHRPPISAIYFENRQHKICASAHVWTKSQFNAPQTVRSILEGACILKLLEREEEYYLTFPTYYAHGLLVGTLRMEIGDSLHIVCKKTGLRADIDFHQKPTFGGADKHNALDGHIRRIPAAGAEPAKRGWFGGSHAPVGDDLFRVHGHWDKVLYIAPAAGGKDEVLLDIENAPVAPKRVLPTSLQGPWESRRLWQFTAAQLNTRPAVAWDEVDREKAQLEKEQRLLPCHAFKHGHDGFVEWSTKKFHLKTVHNPLTNEDVELYMFDDMLTLEKAAAGGEALNVLELSRTLPDIRGGLNGAGAVTEHVEAMKSVTVSSKRVESGWEKF